MTSASELAWLIPVCYRPAGGSADRPQPDHFNRTNQQVAQNLLRFPDQLRRGAAVLSYAVLIEQIGGRAAHEVLFRNWASGPAASNLQMGFRVRCAWRRDGWPWVTHHRRAGDGVLRMATWPMTRVLCALFHLILALYAARCWPGDQPQPCLRRSYVFWELVGMSSYPAGSLSGMTAMVPPTAAQKAFVAPGG